MLSRAFDKTIPFSAHPHRHGRIIIIHQTHTLIMLHSALAFLYNTARGKGALSGLQVCFESKLRGSIPHRPMLFCLSWLLQILLVLLTVAFFTLFERKVMALTHLRLGPNKVSLIGLIQPLLDAFKLLRKQSLISLRTNKYVYSIAPQLSLFLSLSFWLLIPSYSYLFTNSLSLLSFLFIGSAIVFANLLAG